MALTLKEGKAAIKHKKNERSRMNIISKFKCICLIGLASSLYSMEAPQACANNGVLEEILTHHNPTVKSEIKANYYVFKGYDQKYNGYLPEIRYKGSKGARPNVTATINECLTYNSDFNPKHDPASGDNGKVPSYEYAQVSYQQRRDIAKHIFPEVIDNFRILGEIIEQEQSGKRMLMVSIPGAMEFLNNNGTSQELIFGWYTYIYDQAKNQWFHRCFESLDSGYKDRNREHFWTTNNFWDLNKSYLEKMCSNLNDHGLVIELNTMKLLASCEDKYQFLNSPIKMIEQEKHFVPKGCVASSTRSLSRNTLGSYFK